MARRASISTDDAVLAASSLRLERTLDQDVAYGFRLLVDIAERSLADSPFLDPTTAVQAIDRLHDCLRQLARPAVSRRRHRDGAGELRLVVPSMDWDAYVHLAFDEIRISGAGCPGVTSTAVRARRSHHGRTAGSPSGSRTPDRPAVIVDDRLDEGPEDARMALNGDRQGLGVAAGSTAIGPTASAVTLPSP